MRALFIIHLALWYDQNMETQDIPQPEQERTTSMTEAETMAFLGEKGVTLLRFEDYKTGQTVLYVMEQFTQAENGPFQNLPPDKRPSIARLDKPGKLDLEHPYLPEEGEDMQDRIVYDLYNDGNQVDYYAIDPKTKQPVWVKTSYTKTDLEADKPIHPYKVRQENIFRAADELFPKGQ